jgi:hypothetical protein
MPDLGAAIAYLVLEPGADVYDTSGERVGAVEHVLADADVDIFDGIVIDTRVGPGGLRFADAGQIDALYERGVVLNVAVDELHDPEPAPASLSAEPGDEESELTAKLRRAWDWISGRY